MYPAKPSIIYKNGRLIRGSKFILNWYCTHSPSTTEWIAQKCSENRPRKRQGSEKELKLGCPFQISIVDYIRNNACREYAIREGYLIVAIEKSQCGKDISTSWVERVLTKSNKNLLHRHQLLAKRVIWGTYQAPQVPRSCFQ